MFNPRLSLNRVLTAVKTAIALLKHDFTETLTTWKKSNVASRVTTKKYLLMLTQFYLFFLFDKRHEYIQRSRLEICLSKLYFLQTFGSVSCLLYRKVEGLLYRQKSTNKLCYTFIFRVLIVSTHILCSSHYVVTTYLYRFNSFYFHSRFIPILKTI